MNSTLARPSAAVVAVTVVAVVAPLVSVPAPEVMTLNDTLTPPIGLPRLFKAVTSSDFEAAVLCSTDWLFPLVTTRVEAFELFTFGLATTRLNTVLPEMDVANTEMFPFTLPAVKLVVALPLAFVVAVALESVPPFEVVTEKLTAIP